MSDDDVQARQRIRAAGKQAPVGPYTTKDFQLEVLGKLEEMQALTESLPESWRDELKEIRSQNNPLRFEARTLIAIGAVALSITGYVLQDARNTSKRDAEIETTKARVVALERIAATNTEGRIRMEVELEELRDGQIEIRRMITVHDNLTRSLRRGSSLAGSSSKGGGQESDSQRE